MNLKMIFLFVCCLVMIQNSICFSTDLRYHTVVLDDQNKLLPWYSPPDRAYDQYVQQLWEWIPTVPNGPSSSLPMYYLYDGFSPGNSITPDYYENDWGERLPNWVEFGRLYYAYSGDISPLNIAKGLVDYSLDHATTPSNFIWPNFPIGTAEGGATEIQGQNVAWAQWDVLIDLAADMGMSFYKMHLIYGDERYRTAAINTADVLASKIQPGNSTNSPWPYVVNASTGVVKSTYCSNWAGALTLFDLLIEHNEGNVSAYQTARQVLKDWILQYPMQNGNWVDGHSDVHIDGNTNWSNTTKSNITLYLFDNPSFDPNFMTNIPKLLKWTEDNFVYDGGSLAPVYYGAYVVSEQFAYRQKMGYQTSRLAAEYAAWYAVTGDETYKDRAYRGFNYSTYMMKENGESSDGPTDNVGYWWSDCYGEGPRMFFYGFMAVPEWAPSSENHVLYSTSVLKNVSYSSGLVEYTATNADGVEYLRLAFLPDKITVDGTILSLRSDLNGEGYTVKDLGNGDYSVNIKRMRIGDVIVSSGSSHITFFITSTTGTGGTISPLGNIIVNQGVDATFSINPNSGYITSDVKVDGRSVGVISNYTFTNVIANHTITATFSSIPSSDYPPTIVTDAASYPNPVISETATLSVLGADEGGEANLIYTWATIGTPPATVDFSINSANSAKNTIATFTKAGNYTFAVTINDQGNLTVTSNVNVEVNQTFTSITVSPVNANIDTGSTQQFTANANDQFGIALSAQPLFTWAVNGGGTMNWNGLFTAESVADEPYIITASSGGKDGTTNVTVTGGNAILGNNVAGSSDDFSGGNDLNCWRFQAGSSFTASKMQINLASSMTGKMRLAIYSDNNGVPGDLLIGSNEIINPSSGWTIFTLTKGQPITSGTYYWLAAWANTNYAPRSQTTGGTARYVTIPYDTWPNSLSNTIGPYTNKDSIFVEEIFSQDIEDTVL